MQWITAERSPTAVVWDIADTVRAMVDQKYISQAEHTIAGIALWVANAVEEKHLAPEEADQIFTALDARLTWRGGESPLSDDVRDLLVEGGHYHHAGDNLGAGSEEIRRLAGAILRGS
jgi:hypothetical protein